MYSDYWNLTKPPFDNVPDASMYVDCHESMENVIAETIYAIKEGNECLTVIVGEVGLGKTLSLRVIIDSLEPEKYKVALITNPALSFVQLLKEIIGQITGKQCEIKNKVDLQEKFNRLLFETADQGKKIVIVIDEANVLSSSNLDDLRLLTNMQDDERNLFTLLLVGQMEFAKTLENPKRANLFQRIGTYGHLEKLPSEEAVKTYIESRLKIAGTERKIFDDDAFSVIWEFSEHGVPRLINKICKLCIKAGETNEFESISGEVAVQIADRFQKLSKTPMQKRKPQSPPEAEPPSEEGVKKPETETTPRMPRTSSPRTEAPAVKAPEAPISPQREEVKPVQPRTAMPERPPVRPAPPQWEEARSAQPRTAMPEQPSVDSIPVQPRTVMPERPLARTAPLQMEESIPLPPRAVMPEQPPSVDSIPIQREEAIPVQPRATNPEQPHVESIPTQQEEDITVQPRTVPLAKPSTNFVPIPGVPVAKTLVKNIPPQQAARPVETKQEEPIEQQTQEEQETFEEVFIGKQKIQLAIPAHVIKQAQSANTENKNKLAGYWSAQILKGNPQMMHSSLSDPVTVWFEIKNIILKKFNSA